MTSVLLALLLTLPIVAAIKLLLDGKVSESDLISAMVASILVASIVSGFIIYFQQLANELQHDNDHLKAIIRCFPVPIAISNDANYTVTLNPEFVHTFGYTTDDIPTLDDWWSKAYPDESYRQWVIGDLSTRQQKSTKNGTPFEPMEVNIQCKNGDVKTVIASTTPLGVGFEKMQLVVLYDISEKIDVFNELWLMKSIIDNSNLSNFILNPEGKVVFVNDYACQVLGYTRDELTQMHPWDFDPDFNAEAWPGVWSQLKADKAVNIETRHRRKDGTVLDVEVRGHYIAHRAHEYSFTFVQDITERKIVDAELRIAATAFESQEGMIITDANSKILKINHSFTRITGFTSEEALGRKMTLLKSGIHDTGFYRGMWDSIQSTGSWQGEIWNRRKNGDIYPEWLTITAVKDAGGVVTHYVGTMIDITARKAIEDRVHHLAHYDVLTDLPNRALLSDRLHQALAQAKRDKSKLALIFLDLDYFKPVNDELGHEIGDLLLKQVALRLQHCIKRETDTLSRVGGDEFVIILSHIESDQDAALMADKIILSLIRPFEIEENVINISCSIGIGVYPSHGKDATSLMRVADNAMYQAKRAGRGRFCFYNPDTVNEKLTTRS
ncbi:MAG: diguanylate cyclase [Methylotenera sp.]|nr:diguanylate cyclase [Methylotenera sp.]MDO9234132.1 diguanylate cyclase [Methylotenera sp.]MDO9234237.1 diguanylate cyclase [Methylotenera sp.]MDO9389408.1 diguanylate cyclase [Methylotenera sp.]MDP2103274.1 diguanylate cyclase [Methylotenera sp.]